uniref:(northern house mosquito) hypothetical protein n=1 Tax=Culex pipiens TaxID=7175 RepID=A0A8D8C422_CULPI
MIVSSTSVQNPPDHHRWRELFGGDSISMWKLLFFDMALYSPAQLAFIVHLIVANSTNLSRMNSAGCRRQSCSNKFDLTQCDQCKAARKQTKKSLSLSQPTCQKSMLLRFRCLLPECPTGSRAPNLRRYFAPLRLFTYRRLTCSFLPAAHKHHALSSLPCFKSDSDYVLCSQHKTATLLSITIFI